MFDFNAFVILLLFFFFFKQKTAYEMRISDWSSDVCSSDLREHQRQRDVVLLFFLDQRIGQPGADIGLALAARRLDLVEAEPRHGAAEEGRRLAHRIAVGAEPADEGILHHILGIGDRSEEHTSELQSLMRISYAVFCLKK